MLLVPSAHELEDGFLERALEVVIRDERLQVRFYAGLTETTMVQWLEAWEENPSVGESSVRDQFKHELSKRLQRLLELTVNGERAELKFVGIEDCPRHQFDFLVHLENTLPADQTLEIKLTDRGLDHWKSAARYSLKGLGTTMISKSNVAPIIIRSRRIEFDPMPEKTRIKHSTIIATVTTPPSDPKN